MYRTGKSMNNLLSYCGLVDVRINASDKDLPVQKSSLVLKSSYSNDFNIAFKPLLVFEHCRCEFSHWHLWLKICASPSEAHSQIP